MGTGIHTCEFDECGNRATRKGLCNPHYEQQRRRGYMTPLQRRRPEMKTLEEKVAWYVARAERKPNGCLELEPSGGMAYPATSHDGRIQAVGRLVLEANEGPAEGRSMLHSCDNPRCVNLQHLRWGNTSDNSRDMVSRGRGAWEKLRPFDVRCIRALAKTGLTRRQLAERFDVNYETIRGVLLGKTWAWV